MRFSIAFSYLGVEQEFQKNWLLQMLMEGAGGRMGSSVVAEAPPSNPTVLLSLNPQPASSCAGPATAARSWWSPASESCGQRCKQVGVGVDGCFLSPAGHHILIGGMGTFAKWGSDLRNADPPPPLAAPNLAVSWLPAPPTHSAAPLTPTSGDSPRMELQSTGNIFLQNLTPVPIGVRFKHLKSLTATPPPSSPQARLATGAGLGAG